MRPAKGIQTLFATDAKHPAVPQGPDEQAYTHQAKMWASLGRKGYRALVSQYLGDSGRHTLPSPVRWGQVVGSGALVRRLGETWGFYVWNFFSLLLAVLVLPLPRPFTAGLVSAAPLLALLSKRRLQDLAVAGWFLVSYGCLERALVHDRWAWTLAACAAMGILLGVKEGAVFLLPALALEVVLSHRPAELSAFVGAAFVWGAGYLAVGGRLRDLAPLFRAARGAHDHTYGKMFQRGAWHRGLVDLILVSPVAVCGALAVGDRAMVAVALLAVLAHAFSPVQNARLLVGADLLLRLAWAKGMPNAWWGIAVAACLVSDMWLAKKLDEVYDPTTADLAISLGMVPKSSGWLPPT